MVPTITARPASRTGTSERPGVSRPSGLPADLDALLFQHGSWRALDDGNRQVAGVYAETLHDALALVGRGTVATIYGRLIPAVRVVDIDIDDLDGYSVVDQLEAWAEQHDVWHLTRPSGGADGRHHVYLLTQDARGDHLRDLEHEVARLRAWYEVPHRAIDVRDQVRPLSAPHRLHGVTQPYGDTAAALTDLQRRLAATPRHADAPGARGPAAAEDTHQDRRTPLLPRPRARRALPPAWAAYLATGEPPPLGGHDHSRTAVEAVCIGQMIRAGYTWRDALHAIWDAHDDAMTRARTRGLHRLTGIWNRAVLDDHAWTAKHGITREDVPQLPPETAAALEQMRDRLHALAWTYTPRQRPALLHVGDAVLARMARTHTLRVPCPERDLAQDTGLDRSTVRAALRRLHAGGVAILHTDVHTHSPQGRATTSHEIEAPPARGVREIPPPSSHTPFPAAPGTWRALPPRAHQLHRALPPPAKPGLHLPALAREALASDNPDADLTDSQSRTLTTTLRALARAGLAACDEHGRWTRRDEPTPEHATAAAAAHTQALTQHEAERTAYRACTGTDYATARRDTLARNHDREQAWWRSLTAAERAERRDTLRSVYRALPLAEQSRVKDQLAQRRHRAGVDEADRHAVWIAAWHPDGLAQRQAEHQHGYRQLHPAQRAAHVAMWHDHRTRWGIPHPQHLTPSTASG